MAEGEENVRTASGAALKRSSLVPWVVENTMQGLPPKALLRFDGFELDPSTGELHRSGEVIRLQPQPSKVLIRLATAAGEVVSREALYRLLWPEGRHVDAERGLNFCIKELRRSLGDDARDPRFIETLPRRGYRFVAEVTAVSRPRSEGWLRVAESEGTGEREATTGWRSLSARRFRLPAVMALLVVSAALAGALLVRSDSSLGSTAGLESSAPEAYLQGKFLIAGGTLDGFDRGLQAFRQAVEQDPHHALSWTALSETHLMRARWVPNDLQKALDAALQTAQRAVELDPYLAVAQIALSRAALYRDLDWRRAESAVDRALELDPRSAAGYSHRAFLRAGQGRFAQALADAELARRLKPEDPSMQLDLGWYYYLARDYEKAAAACGDALKLDPSFQPAKDCLSSVQLVERPELDPTGEADRRQLVESLKESAEASRCAAVPLATELTTLGDFDAAFHWLEVAFETRSSWLPLVAAEPRLEPLHRDPRWRSLIDRLGLDIDA